MNIHTRYSSILFMVINLSNLEIAFVFRLYTQLITTVIVDH